MTCPSEETKGVAGRVCHDTVSGARDLPTWHHLSELIKNFYSLLGLRNHLGSRIFNAKILISEMVERNPETLRNSETKYLKLQLEIKTSWASSCLLNVPLISLSLLLMLRLPKVLSPCPFIEILSIFNMKISNDRLLSSKLYWLKTVFFPFNFLIDFVFQSSFMSRAKLPRMYRVP